MELVSWSAPIKVWAWGSDHFTLSAQNHCAWGEDQNPLHPCKASHHQPLPTSPYFLQPSSPCPLPSVTFSNISHSSYFWVFALISSPLMLFLSPTHPSKLSSKCMSSGRVSRISQGSTFHTEHAQCCLYVSSVALTPAGNYVLVFMVSVHLRTILSSTCMSDIETSSIDTWKRKLFGHVSYPFAEGFYTLSCNPVRAPQDRFGTCDSWLLLDFTRETFQGECFPPKIWRKTHWHDILSLQGDRSWFYCWDWDKDWVWIAPPFLWRLPWKRPCLQDADIPYCPVVSHRDRPPRVRPVVAHHCLWPG